MDSFNPPIEVRFHQPAFSKTAVRGHIEGGLPDDLRTPVSWPQAREAMGDRRRRGWYEPQLVGAHLIDLLWSRFHFDETGLYLLGHGSGHGVALPEYVAQEGICGSEGMLNHVHLHMYFDNPVAQFELGVALVQCWSRAFREIDELPGAVIYLHGWGRFSNYWIICPYSGLSAPELGEVDQRIGGLTRLSSEQFLEWAL